MRSAEAVAARHQSEGSRLKDFLAGLKPEDIVGTGSLGVTVPARAMLAGLLKEGKTIAEIAEHVGVRSTRTVWQWLKNYGLSPVGTPGAKPKIDLERLKELSMQTTDKTVGRGGAPKGIKTWKQIGAELGVSDAAAHRMAVRKGFIPGPE
jgi:transposase